MAISVTTEPDTPAASGTETVSNLDWPSPRRAYYTVFVLALVVMFAEVDRGVMSLLVSGIKKDFALSDASIGLLMGIAFSIFYTFCGIPLSRYIDRNNRKNILSVALGVWSVATMFCGIAQNFIQLFLARLFLGAGESVNGPAIFSMISDSFPKERLPRAIALMQIGVLFGNAFALIMGAVVIQLLVGMPAIHIGGIGVIRWWQMVFIVIGLPGVLVAGLLALTVKEPLRRGVGATTETIGMGQVIRFLWSKRPVFGPQYGSMAISALAMGALSWYPVFYERTYGWLPQKIGMYLGVMQMITSPIGLFGGVWLYEQFVKRGFSDAAYRVVVYGRLAALPMAILMPLMPTPWLALAVGALSGILIGFSGASTNATLQIVAPANMRGQMTALFMFLYSVIGNGVSPWLIGLLSTYVFKDEHLIRYALLSVSAVSGPLSLAVFWLGWKPYKAEVERLEAIGVA